jgi:predicted NBD/HSP70 family sugar kinase
LPNYLCIDAGFTHTRFAFADGSGLSAVRSLATVDTHGGARRSPDWRQGQWLDWLHAQIAESCAEGGRLDAVGLCLPGPVGADGTIAASNSLWGQASQPLLPAQIGAVTGCPVTVCNDLFAAATYYGSDPALGDVETVLVVSVGSGIGSKLYDRRAGRVVSGRHGLEGEIGYAVVEHGDGAAQTQDGLITGTVGLYSSGSGFARMLRAEAEAWPQDYRRSAISRNLHVAGFEIGTADRYQINTAALAAIRESDAFARRILHSSIRYLARALHVAILLAAPDRVVITGGFALAVGPEYRRILVAELAALLRPLHSHAALDAMIRSGRSDGTDNLRGMALRLHRLDGDMGAPARYFDEPGVRS